MKKKLVALSICLAFFGMAGMAQATLITIGTATYGGSDYNLIWDDDNNGNSVVWLDYSNAGTNWSAQMSWAAGLNGNGVLTYNLNPGYSVDWNNSAWRLPSTVDGQYQYGYDGTTTAGCNITSSEMGHLYYEELGNLGYDDTSGNYQSSHGLQYTGDFDNLLASWYWSGTEYAMNTGVAWYLYMDYGYQGTHDKGIDGYGLALRSGQVSAASPVPEPATMLLFSTGLVGLAGYRRKRKGMSS